VHLARQGGMKSHVTVCRYTVTEGSFHVMAIAILRRKLMVPPVWPEAVARARLVALLDRAFVEGQHLALVAGSGFGKTALLAEWAGARATAWITLDAEDADLDSFLAYVIAACEGALEGFTTEARGMLGRAREREGAFAALSALLADLDEQCDGPLVLVLDDYHQAASPSLDALLARMLKCLPERIRVAFTTRKAPAIELNALRAKRQVLLLGEDELAFDLLEMEALRPELHQTALVAQWEASGGWPAAMGLAPDLLEAYLDEQVLVSQDPATRALLSHLALVDAFDDAFCEEVLGAALTVARRERLLADRLIVATEPDRHAVPQPLRGILRRRFGRDVPTGERLGVLRKVGDHHWGRGQAATAIRFWVDAGASAWAAEKLASVAEDWLAAGRLEVLANLIAAVGEQSRRPELWASEAELHRRWGDFDRAEALFEEAYRAFDARLDALGCARTRLRQAQAAASCGKVLLAQSRLLEARPGLGEGDRFAIDVLNLEGGLGLLAGSTLEAIAHFEASLRLAKRLADPYAAARAIHNLGVCYTRLGEFGRALECYDAALAPAGDDGTPTVWMTPINRALVLVYLERPLEAAAAAELALALVRRYKLAREEGYALRILGYAQSRLASHDAARASFEAAELLARRMDDTLGIALSLNFQADLAVRVGDVPAALRASAEIEALLGGGEAVFCLPELAHVRAKIALAAGQLDEAETLVANLLQLAQTQGYKQILQEAQHLQADLLKARERPVASLVGLVPRAHGGPVVLHALDIRCFGGVRVKRAGVEVGEREWQSARAKLLLAYLLHTPEGATKARLFDAIYPGEQPTDASMNMNLMRLRKALEPGLEKGQPSRYILRNDGRYAFNRQADMSLDTQAFENALRQAKLVTGAAKRAWLENALVLYTHEFLPEFDQEWVVALRLRYQEQALEACRALVTLLDEQSPSHAMGTLERALEIDPLSEEFNRELILRLLEADEPRRALQHFRLCERRFQEMLETPPPSDLASLVKGL
jgi:ATP/maltotriose-dependent transcriptional regulator MalT/DNA-binding SARP family transcriptional activator